MILCFFLVLGRLPRSTLFPTRRSSDLVDLLLGIGEQSLGKRLELGEGVVCVGVGEEIRPVLDRKSTRLNSSHRCSSYAVFCLKKKRCSISQRRRGLRHSALGTRERGAR